MERRRFNGSRFFLVFILTTFIFLMGLWFGQNMLKSKISEIEKMQNDFRTETSTLEVEYMFLNQKPCSIINSSELSMELYQMGNRLEFMEDSYGKNNLDVLSLKGYYSLLEMRHWLFFENVRQQCNFDVKTILYFYSNVRCDRCDEQGYVLTFLRNKYPNLNVYSFDVDIDNSALNMLKEHYNIDSSSALPIIILGNKTFDGFTPLETLQNEL